MKYKNNKKTVKRQVKNNEKKINSKNINSDSNNIFKNIAFIDFETKSFLDISESGAAAYAEHPTTEIILFGVVFNNEETPVYWQPGEKMPEKIRKFKGLIVAHNYLFECFIIKNKLKGLLPAHWHTLKNYSCTMATAYRCGLPGALGTVSRILKTKHSKQVDSGKFLIHKYSKPVTDRKTGEKSFREITPEDFKQWKEYNKNDILATRDIFEILPKLHLDAYEYKIFQLDGAMNSAGVKVDSESVEKLISAFEKYSEKAEKEAEKMAGRTGSGTLVLKSTTAFKPWLNSNLPEVYRVDNAQAFTLDQLEKSIFENNSKAIINKKFKTILKALELKKLLSGSAVKKLYRFRAGLCTDGTLKGLTQYYGAHTGRRAGRLVQPHNFPRKSSDNFEKDVKALYENKIKSADAIETFNSLLRQLIIPRPGTLYAIGDFSAIEARVNFWLAGCVPALDIYRKGLDIYKETAAGIYQIKYENISDKQRFLGKTAVLGLGYGMGKDKFKKTCFGYGVPISFELADKAVKLYRTKFIQVPTLWQSLEISFKRALQNGSALYNGKFTQIEFKYSGNTLKIKLPSGRLIYYFLPTVSKSGSIKFCHPKHGFIDIWGGVICENIVQAISRDLLAEAQIKCQDNKILNPVLEVHDEILTEVKKADAKKGLKELQKIMSTPPAWADSLPLGAECSIEKRYRKI